MKFKKLWVIVLAGIMTFGMTATASAKADASWNAGKGTATIDGVKDDSYATGQQMDMDAVSDGTADGTVADAWAIYDDTAVYFFVEVADSSLDDTNANVWEKDSVEFRTNKGTLMQAFAVDESFTGTVASEVKVLKTDKGYNVEFKVPYTAKEGESMKFSLQVNAASGGKRNCTLHTNEDLKDAWQNDDVFENLVFSTESAAAAPKTGVVSFGLIFAAGAIGSAAGAKICRRKEK